MTGIASQATHTTVTLDEKDENGTKSIRQICRQGILAGKPTKETTLEIVALHPNSRAALRSAKHIAWYRAQMKKAGELSQPLVD